MDFILHKTEDANNVIGKVLTDSLTIQILLKASTDVFAPKITLTSIDGVEIRDFNYCEIPELGMKYFIDDFEIVSNKLIILGCRVDYIETHKDKILASLATVKRKAVAGDYGDVSLDVTGRVEYVNYRSDVELVPDNGAILSILKGEEA